MQPMETLSETINRLRKEGYTEDFNLHENSLVFGNNKLGHDEFIIDKYFRFEGQSDPADEATVYAISSIKHKNVKGVLVNGAGIYTDSLTDEMLKKLDMKPR